MSAATPLFLAAGLETAEEVMASLPLSYAASSTVEGAITVLAGGRGWPASAGAALDAGALGVVVVRPSPDDVTDLKRRPRGLVALDSRWAANPAVETAGSVFADALPTADRLECRAVLARGSELVGALLDQLTLVRALVGPVTKVRIVTENCSGYSIQGEAAGHPIDLDVVCTGSVPDSVSVRLLTSDGSVDLYIPDGQTAQPGRLVTTTPEGARLAPTLYESGHRATWRRVRSLLDLDDLDDLDDFSSDETTAREAFQQLHQFEQLHPSER